MPPTPVPPTSVPPTQGPRPPAAPGLPPRVVAAIRNPAPGRTSRVEAAGYGWHLTAWGDQNDPGLLLIHGVTSDAETFWRLAPALAAAGWHVVAVDLPGHGRTGGWRGRHRFDETAADVVGLVDRLARPRASRLGASQAGASRAGASRAGASRLSASQTGASQTGAPEDVRLDPVRLAVLGHSWGAMVAAALPRAGLAPRTLILLDPPCLPVRLLELMTHDPEEQPSGDLHLALSRLRDAHPEWAEGDVLAKAVGLTRFDAEAVRAVLLENGDWDGGLSALADPRALGVNAWLIRGDPKAGCLVPDEALPALRARFGDDHLVTIAGAPHSPQRTHLESTTAAILRALGSRPRP